MKDTILAADLFCGAGGTSQGLLMAANELNADLDLVAINHWSVAIDTHSVNHPYARHLCAGLDNVDPRKLIPGGRLKVMCASPECTHHSVARGGKPMSDQSRASAWHILRFAEALYIDNLVIENVKEFQSWGPLGANGRPMKSKRGQLFAQFIGSLKALGYNVDWRVLNCADYGDPTTRERLFIIARRGGKPVTWPEATHVPPVTFEGLSLFGEQRKPWRTAREIIDWSASSKSIFERKKPLAEKTLRRIEAGLRKFCGIDADLRKCMAEGLRPFLVVFRNNADAVSVDRPMPTITTSGNHVGLVEPFAVLLRKGQGARSVDEPLATLTTKGANYGIAEPFIVPHGRRNPPRSLDRPVDTITTTSTGVGMCEAFLVPQFGERDGQDPRCHAIDRPVPAVTSHGAGALVQAFLSSAGGPAGKGRNPRSVDDPIPTLVTENHLGLVEPFLMPIDHSGSGPNAAHAIDAPVGTLVTKENRALVTPFLIAVNHGDGCDTRRAQSVDAPMRTVTQKIGGAVCEPFLVGYYGTENMSGADEPVPTVTTRDRFAVVEARQCPTENGGTWPEADEYMLDIRFRMLSPRELARAQGFPDSYDFSGNREAVVKQIGNAVPPNTARALLMEVLA